MENIKEIAFKTERKLNEQTAEFNIVRDRSLLVSTYGVALLSAIFTFWNNFGEYSALIMTAIAFISLISISIMIYAAFSNPLSRGMDTSTIKNLFENPSDDDYANYYLYEISYNLESFEDNSSLLKSLQWKFNLGILTQAIITISSGIITYFNFI
jgi:hypothetical protein